MLNFQHRLQAPAPAARSAGRVNQSWALLSSSLSSTAPLRSTGPTGRPQLSWSSSLLLTLQTPPPAPAAPTLKGWDLGKYFAKHFPTASTAAAASRPWTRAAAKASGCYWRDLKGERGRNDQFYNPPWWALRAIHTYITRSLFVVCGPPVWSF